LPSISIDPGQIAAPFFPVCGWLQFGRQIAGNQGIERHDHVIAPLSDVGYFSSELGPTDDCFTVLSLPILSPNKFQLCNQRTLQRRR
jgi:hypothetical protein